MKLLFSLAWIVTLLASSVQAVPSALILSGASQTAKYLPLLEQKRVALVANNSSQVAGQSIIAVLLEHKINLVKVFSPEHGFDGRSDAGAKVTNTQASAKQIAIISLYGAKNKPTAADLADVDIIVFDLQDVGVRFYTYISSLQKIMEAALENKKTLIILDRPNPNAWYIDGPLLKPKYKSFVGMQPVPIVYAMTIGEYARMLNGEKWLELTPNAKAQQLNLIIIPLQNYSHNQQYQLKNKPSPNLPNMTAIYWYPSLGLFEGTKLSVGRGTAMPFQVIGNPSYTQAFSFTPKAISGAINPPFKDQLCHGWNLQMDESSARRKINGQLQLNYLIQAYQENNDKPHFFSAFFNKLAGSDKLRQQIVAGLSESEIRASWQPDLSKFKKIRAKYLLYPDN